MKKSVFLETYPVCSMELDKSEVTFSHVNEIIEYFKEKIDTHKKATFIAIFDHYAHTKNLGGEINPEILDAKNIVFVLVL